MNESAQFQLGKRESMMITVVILGLGLVYQLFWLNKRRAEILETTNRIALVEQALRDDQTMETQLLTRVPAEIRENEGTTTAGSVPYIIENNQHYANLIKELSSPAPGEEQFRLKKITVEKESKQSGYTELELVLEVDGSFFSIGKFLERLERSPLLTEVTAVDIFRMERELRKCSARINLNGFLIGG